MRAMLTSREMSATYGDGLIDDGDEGEGDMGDASSRAWVRSNDGLCVCKNGDQGSIRQTDGADISSADMPANGTGDPGAGERAGERAGSGLGEGAESCADGEEDPVARRLSEALPTEAGVVWRRLLSDASHLPHLRASVTLDYRFPLQRTFSGCQHFHSRSGRSTPPHLPGQH